LAKLEHPYTEKLLGAVRLAFELSNFSEKIGELTPSISEFHGVYQPYNLQRLTIDL
jgi:hypothetical protein